MAKASLLRAVSCIWLLCILPCTQLSEDTSDEREHSREHAHARNLKGNQKYNEGRQIFFVCAISALLVLGLAVTYCFAYSYLEIIAAPFILLLPFHGLAQFLPWIALWFHAVDCDSGILWEWHSAYALVLVLAAPSLGTWTIASKKLLEKGRIPCLDVGGTPYVVYNYCTTLLAAFDQYSDCAATVLAFACGWDRAWMMAAVFFSSFMMQAAVAAYFVGCEEGLLPALLGANTEASAVSGNQDNVKAHAILALVKLFTEILPQSCLSWIFACDVKPNKFIWVSIGASLAMGLKSAASGASYFLSKRPYISIPQG